MCKREIDTGTHTDIFVSMSVKGQYVYFCRNVSIPVSISVAVCVHVFCECVCYTLLV